MSDKGGQQTSLRSSLMKSRIAKLPHLPATAPSQWASSSSQNSIAKDEEGEEEDDVGTLSSAQPPLHPPRHRAGRRRADNDRQSYTSLSADDCFQLALEVEIEDEPQQGVEGAGEASTSTFRVYYTPPKRKVSSRSKAAPRSEVNQEAELSSLEPPADLDEVDDSTTSSTNAGTVFFFHHGAGYSALSYALVAKHIAEVTEGEVGVLAFDCRGHGKSRHTASSRSSDMRLQQLTEDSVNVLEKVFPPSQPQPTLILVGHSMGGSVVVSLCHALARASKHRAVPRVAGLAVLDVVEGTAMSALSSMKTIISAIPRGFASVEEAIQWHIDSGTIVNLDSARRSVPSLLVENEAYVDDKSVDSLTQPTSNTTEPLEELADDPSHPLTIDSHLLDKPKYIWRADLLKTEPYWAGWFQGLSQSFLSAPCARLLLLAGTDRLDKDLMIGQMQGKYQLVVFADVGHSLQEDAPKRTAQTLIDFWKRNESLDVSAIRGGLRKVGQ